MKMDHTPYKPSKIPVLNKRVKMLKPIRHQKLVESDCFKYCRNCCNLKNDLSVLEQNLKTLLKENNFLRQQLSLSESNSDTNNSEQVTTISSVVEGEKQDISQNSPANSYSNQNSIQPFYLLPEHSFSNFDVNMLCSEIDYSHCLNNRKVKFYGDAPYRYGDTLHEPCPVPKNSYILTIMDQVKLMFPHYSFNSVLINQYDNGSNYIPMHADDEAQIKPDSDILTISLGESRIIRFCPKNSVLGSETSINLQHGDVFIMSAVSQKLFKHGIPKEFGKGMRISLTFRDLIHIHEIELNSSFVSTDISLDLSAIETTLASTPGAPNTIPNSGPNCTPLSVQSYTHLTSKHINRTPTKSYQNEPAPSNVSDGPVETIYISSSMFADLDEAKLSSEHHKVKVFFYRGATAGGILRRLKNDPKFLTINPDNIKQVFIMCGSNDVDSILHVDRNMHTSINVDFKNFDIHKFNNTTNDVKCLVDFIHEWSSNVKINLINILPRASRHRNNVINNINQYIRNICLNNNYLNFIDTEYKLYLFSNSDGYRKSIYFKPIGTDNVHLNKSGVVRFGKHLKYLLHLDCPRGQTSS